jgi:hypothetical protein
LLVAVDAVAGDAAGGVRHRLGLGLEGGDIAARVRFGDRIGHEGLACGDLAEPFALLILGRPDNDGVGPQLDGEESRGDAEANLGHFAGNRATVARPATQAAVGFRNHQQLQTDLGPQHLTDDVLGEDLFAVEFEDARLG